MFYDPDRSQAMMKHRCGLDRLQRQLLPEALEDYIGPENPVRFLDAFVASLDLHALSFAKTFCASTGSPPYHPADLLKLYLYGYLHRTRSSRLLEQECHRNVEVIWLLGKLAPDFKTIADFRKDHRQPLQAVARQFTLLCRKLELFGGQLIGLDGTKLSAVNSKDANYNEKKLQELIARADAHIAAYLQQLDQADEAQPQTPAPTRAELEEKIAALREKKDWHQELLAQLKDSGETQVSLTDETARRMRGGGGASVVGYNAQAAVDEKHKLIVAADVTHQETDVGQLSPMALEAKANLGVEKLEVVADSGYSHTSEVMRCEQEGITPYVPQADTSANTARGLYGKSQFRYDAQKDVYICPAGAELTYRFSTEEKERRLRYYRTPHCGSCTLKTQCTRNLGNRRITREEDEAVMEAMAARMKAQPQKYELRKGLCEHPFGTLKRWFGYSYFLMKGLEKVRCEWSLMTLAYNLKRVLHLVSFEQLMAAVGMNAPQKA
jgi:transposase